MYLIRLRRVFIGIILIGFAVCFGGFGAEDQERIGHAIADVEKMRLSVVASTAEDCPTIGSGKLEKGFGQNIEFLIRNWKSVKDMKGKLTSDLVAICLKYRANCANEERLIPTYSFFVRQFSRVLILEECKAEKDGIVVQGTFVKGEDLKGMASDFLTFLKVCKNKESAISLLSTFNNISWHSGRYLSLEELRGVRSELESMKKNPIVDADMLEDAIAIIGEFAKSSNGK